MHICASTNSHGRNLWADHTVYPCEDSLRALREAGFERVDINLHDYTRPGEPMTRADWRKWCERQRQVADDCGVLIPQAHAPFYALCADGTETAGDRLRMERAIEGAAICGVRWMVFHPYDVQEDGWFSQKKSFEYNYRLFEDYARLCKPLGVHIAIENMVGNANRGRRYCSAQDELIELVDALNDPIFGICWDFGHANLNGVDQRAALLKIGKRLHAVHVNDNLGHYDDHIAPYFGTIRWERILETLKEIEYDGDWTYEIHNFHNGLPDAMQMPTLKYTYELARYMTSLVK